MIETTPTPMVRQYLALKEKHKDCLLFFRLGDFYELFYEDAHLASSALDIVLTKRGKDDEAMPMCGIPFHSAETYIARLIRQGFKVAICEQLETPEEAKKRGHKAIVQRDVVRIITPGTLLEENLLDSDQNNFLISLHTNGKSVGMSAIDISTGDFFVESLLPDSLDTALSRFSPKEILLSERILKTPALYDTLKIYDTKLTRQSDSRFDYENSQKRLCQFFKIATLTAFGEFSEMEVSAAGCALEYVYLTQKEFLPRLNTPKKISIQNFLQIDAATRRSLELDSKLNGDRKGSFFSVIDKTLTAGGKRLLAHSLSFPSRSLKTINDRLDKTEWLLKNKPLHETLKKSLGSFPDGERILGRLSSRRSGPRDLLAIKNLLITTGTVFENLKASASPFEPPVSALLSLRPLKDTLARAITPDAPFLAREGNFILPGYLKELDEIKSLRDESQRMVAALQTQYVNETQIPTLKIKYNNILGYYIEITSLHKTKVPEHFIHRQTLANNMRFSTPELIEIQEKLMGASEKALALELGLFQELTNHILSQSDALCQVIEFMSSLDLISSFATLSASNQYTRPLMRDEPVLIIKKGRHPTVEPILLTRNLPFISNDCILHESQRFLLLTGPNMGGKSTYLRQNALIVLLAQMGCYVPAEAAEIGIVDRLFSRVGAGDDLSRGHSTFMMEMIETAAILNQATEKSFVILDEIGRGTSTYDGLSIAQATAEHLHTHNKCRTLFATHYHEMTALESSLKSLKCYTVSVKEWEGTIVFLHTIIQGTASQSYGIHVAAMAGVPKPVIHRAEAILKALESKNTKGKPLPLFSQLEGKTPSLSGLEQILHGIDPNKLSPREALDLVYQLKEKMNEPCPL